MKIEMPTLEFFPPENRETIRKERSELSDDEWNSRVRFYESVNAAMKDKARAAVTTYDLGVTDGIELCYKTLGDVLTKIRKSVEDRKNADLSKEATGDQVSE